MLKTIVHLDINAFFASVEQQANPYLRNRPVAVIKGYGRSCIIAASFEAKKFGVKTGCRTWEAQHLCPKITFVPADFEKYLPMTEKLIAITQRFAPLVEVFSLDEVFLDLTGLPSTTKIIQKIQKTIKEEVGSQITVSAGVSYNKLLAKLASDLAGKEEILIINRKNKDEFLGKIKPSAICGIGSRIEARLFNLGIKNLLTIRKIPEDFLRASFGPWWARRLKEISWGIDDSSLTPLSHLPMPKSVGRTFTLFKNTYDLKIIKATLRNLSEEVGEKVRQMKLVGRTVGLGIRGDDQEFFQEKTLKDFLDDGQLIFETSWQIFKQKLWLSSVRFLGVWLTNLYEKKFLSYSLFEETKKREKVLEAVDKVNHRFGSLTIFPGVLLGQKLIRPEVTGFLGDKKFWLENLHTSGV